jgi:hypothetical protein
MADFIRVDQGANEDIFDLIGKMPDKALRYLRETIDEIADQIEQDANRNIPEDTGELRSVGISRVDSKRRVRGPGGLVVKTELSVPKVPEYAKWVHDGTGIYGPRGLPIIPRTAKFMVFQIDGKWFRKHEVYGQRPQPFLKEAVEEAQRSTIPIELAELRAKIETLL